MDLQPQLPAAVPLPPPHPTPAEAATAAACIKRKHHSSEPGTAAEEAGEQAAEAPAPVRTSVRVKLRRSGSASKHPASSAALSGKQLSEASGKRRHKHRHRSHAPPGEAGETLTPPEHGSDTPEAGMAGSRMHSSSRPGYGPELAAHPSTWHSVVDEQAEPADTGGHGVNSEEAADAASGHSNSQELHEDRDQAAADTEAASDSHAQHAAAMLSRGELKQREPAGGEQAAGQSHVTGAPHSQAQQGGFQMPLDTAHSYLNQREHPGALSMTESTAGAHATSHDQAEGMQRTQAFQMPVSENGQAAPEQYGQRDTPEVATQGGEDSNEQDWLHSSSAEVASPQQPPRQTLNEGSKSVDQMAPKSRRTAGGHGADRAESQLQASRQLKQLQ